MSFIVKVGETRTYTVQNKVVRGFMFNAALLANAANAAFTPADFDPSKIFVSVDLTRQGKKKNLYSDNMLAIISCSYMSNFALLHPKNSTIDNCVLVHASGVVEKRILPYFLDFGNVIDLEADDKIDVTLQFIASSLVGTNLVGSTACYIDIVEHEYHGFEKATTNIETNTIRAGESRMSFPLGDGIRRIVLLNYDKDSRLAVDAPVASVTLSSDKVNYNYTNEQIMSDRQRDFFESSSEEILRRQSLILYDGRTGNLNKCQLEFILTPGNVAVGQNVLVVWRQTASAGLILHGTAKEESAKATRLQKHGLNVGGSAVANKSQLSSLNRV